MPRVEAGDALGHPAGVLQVQQVRRQQLERLHIRQPGQQQRLTELLETELPAPSR